VYPTGVVSVFDHLLMGQLAKDKAFFNSEWYGNVKDI
jgi:hypothetical protein